MGKEKTLALHKRKYYKEMKKVSDDAQSAYITSSADVSMEDDMDAEAYILAVKKKNEFLKKHHRQNEMKPIPTLLAIEKELAEKRRARERAQAAWKLSMQKKAITEAAQTEAADTYAKVGAGSADRQTANRRRQITTASLF
jgi:hypothetical protein